MASNERSVLVLYGSETGNAQDIAEDIGRLAERLHFRSRVEELNTVEVSLLAQAQLTIFVISTTGQGDMPHNALVFWKKLLRRKLPPDCLNSLRYTCFGLGDSTYIKFNWAARKLVRRLGQLGAKTFFDPLEADEQFPDGIDGSFVRWIEDLRSHLLENWPLPDNLQLIPEDEALPPRWSLLPALEKSSTLSVQTRVNGHSESPVSVEETDLASDVLHIPDGLPATMTTSTRLTPETHWQEVRLVTFDIPAVGPSSRLQCHPGDCITIYPGNFSEDVEKLIELMGWQAIADRPLDLSSCGTMPRSLHTSNPVSFRQLLKNNVDITAIPRRSFLRSMAYFSTNPDHKERLIEFTQHEYLDEYFDYATRSRRTILEVLEEFSSVKIPPERLLDVFPLIRGRDFSIANGGNSLNHPTNPNITTVELLVAFVKYRTVLRKPRQGLCSRYIAALTHGSTITVTHKPVLSPIHGPVNALRPLVAMATGTGVAPVRSLIQERLTYPSPGPMVLFFGNRNYTADYFFEEEWGKMKDVLNIFTAFSRDQKEKIYVQDLVKQETPRLREHILQNALFTICGGSSKMADACRKAALDTFMEEDDPEDREKALSGITWWQEIW